MQRNPHSYQIATGYRTFYSLSLIYQPITKKRLFLYKNHPTQVLIIRETPLYKSAVKVTRMPTVVVRFEPNKKNPERGTIYYRIYKGHNRRMEFSSRLHLSASSWDETARTIRDDYPESCRFRVQIEADLRLLNRIITEDITGRLTMGDMIALFKQQRTIIK